MALLVGDGHLELPSNKSLLKKADRWSSTSERVRGRDTEPESGNRGCGNAPASAGPLACCGLSPLVWLSLHEHVNKAWVEPRQTCFHRAAWSLRGWLSEKFVELLAFWKNAAQTLWLNEACPIRLKAALMSMRSLWSWESVKKKKISVSLIWMKMKSYWGLGFHLALGLQFINRLLENSSVFYY